MAPDTRSFHIAQRVGGRRPRRAIRCADASPGTRTTCPQSSIPTTPSGPSAASSAMAASPSTDNGTKAGGAIALMPAMTSAGKATSPRRRQSES